MEILKKYKLLIIGIILVLLIIIATYYLTSNYRTTKKITTINNKYNASINYQTDFCNKNLSEYKLVDFHVLSSTNTFMTGLSMGDYIDIKMLENVLYYGTRYIELEIFSENGKNNSNPVISYGVKKGNWITSYNTIHANLVFKFIADYAFSQRFVSNYMDPLFVYLDIKTDNKKTLDALYDIILSSCNHYLLEKQYLNNNINLARVSVCDLMNRLILFSSPGYEKSKLENIISLSTKGPYLQRIYISDIVSNNTDNSLNAPDISIDNNTISFKNDYLDSYIEIGDHTVNFLNYGITTDFKLKIDGATIPENNTGENLITISEITPNKIVVNKKFRIEESSGNYIRLRFYYNRDINDVTLSNKNKNTLTIVIPDPNILSSNFSPRDAWYAGCQFAALNFQTPDKYMLENFQFFNNTAIKLKINTLRNKTDVDETAIVKEGLVEKYPLPIKPPKFNINYLFLNKYMDNEVYIDTILGENIRLATEPDINTDSNIKLTIEFNSNNSTFKIVPGLSGAQDTVSIKILNPTLPFNKSYYLCIDIKTKNLIARSIDKESIDITSFNLEEKKQYSKHMIEYDKLSNLASFLPLNPISSNPEITKEDSEYVSLAALILNSTIDKKKTELDGKMKLYYLKYNSGYSSKDILYTHNQKLMNKIMSIKNTMKDEITIWRPIREDGFYPLGDYVNINSSIKQTTHDFSGEEFSTYIFTVNGGVEKPIDYELIWTGVQDELPSSDKINESWISIWKPVAPEGYTSLGIIFEYGKTKPSLNIIRCVKTSLLDLAPKNMFMTFNNELSSQSQFNFKSETTAMESKFHQYNLIWNNRYMSNDPIVPLNPPSRKTTKPFGIWGLNLVTRGDFDFKSDIILFDYYIPYELFINNNKIVAPLEFDNPIFIKKEDIVSKDKITIDSTIFEDSNLDNVCFKMNNIYATNVSPLNKELIGEIDKINLYSGNIAYIDNNDNSNFDMCLNLPNSFWSEAYNERYNNDITPNLMNNNLKFSSCKSNNSFGYQWIEGPDNSINLLGNKNYCLTAPTKLDENNKEVIIDDINNPNNTIKLEKCKYGSIGQQFDYIKTESGPRIVAKNPNGKGNRVLYYSNKNNHAQIIDGNIERYRTNFHFNSLPSDYCINIPVLNNKTIINLNISTIKFNKNLKDKIYGSEIFVLYKVRREKKPNLPIEIIPQSIDNPLNEIVDNTFFHIYIKGIVLHNHPDNIDQLVFMLGLNDETPSLLQHNIKLSIKPEFIDYDFYEVDNKKIKIGQSYPLLQIKKDSDSLILNKPIKPKNILKPGTMVLCENGDFNSINSKSPNYIPESCSYYLAKVIEPIKSQNRSSKEIYEYRVIFSINGCEPNIRYKDFYRPNFNIIKTIHINKMYLFRKAPVC